jgi:hypothetical protein
MNPLPHENLLMTMGEVAAAVVGFSLVVGLLRSGQGDEAPRFFSMRDVAEIGLWAVGASFLPLLIHAYGSERETTWNLASIGFLVIWWFGLAISLLRRREDRNSIFPGNLLLRGAALGALNLSGWCLLLLNIVYGGPTSGARYATAVMLFLAVAGLLFVSATFARPESRPSG